MAKATFMCLHTCKAKYLKEIGQGITNKEEMHLCNSRAMVVSL